MDYKQIYEDAHFSAAVVEAGARLIYLGYDTGATGGNVVMRYKDSSGAFGTLSGGSATGLTAAEAEAIAFETALIFG